MAAASLNGPAFSVRKKLLFQFCKSSITITYQVRLFYRLRWKCNGNYVLNGRRNESSKFYRISSVLTKIMLKFFGSVFVVTVSITINMRGGYKASVYDCDA